MDSRKALFTILGGVALTAVIGILLDPRKDTFRRKKIAEKARACRDTAEDTIKDSVTNAENQLYKMDEDIDRMVNEGGRVS